MAFSEEQKMMQTSHVAVVILLCSGLITLCAAQPSTVTVNGSTQAGTVFSLPTTLPTCLNRTITSTLTNKTIFRWNGNNSLVLVHQLKPDDFPKVKCRHEVPSTMKVFINCTENTQKTSLEVDLYYQNPFDNNTSYLCDLNCKPINPTIYVSEDTAVGTTVLNFTICDDDIVFPAQDNIQITSDYLVDKDNSRFILKKKLDYEEKESMTILFSVNNAAANITIIVNDSDDQGIQFTSFIYECQMIENQSSATSGNCSVKANDLDKGINAEITYQLEDVTQGNITTFTISNNGSVQASFLDREMHPQYQLFIKGFQTDRPNDRVNYTSMVIYVTDIDDNPPVMSQQVYNASVMENSPNGTIIYYVSATDIDQGNNAKFYYKLDSNSYFDVHETTGAVTVKGEIDREMNATIILYVHAESYTKEHNSSTSTINLKVIDENDNSPNITSSNTVKINKTMAIGNEVMQITATDNDEGLNKQLYYSMDPASEIFEMDSNGTIRLKRRLNDTNRLQYQLNVIVHDCPQSEKMRRYSSMVLNVTVNDENIHTPEFQNFQQEVHILEDAENGTILLVLTATDKDPTDQLTFSISSGDDDSRFTIHGHRLILKNFLDRETNSSYNLSIQVSDGDHNVTKQTRVIVDDVNDNDPIFGIQTYHFTAEEEKLETLGNVNATDRDFNQSISYTLEQGTLWSDYIQIVKENGTVYLSKPIDRENITLPISLLVFATDNGKPTRSGNATVTIEVLDINDNAPIFDTENKTFSFPEYTQPSFVYNAVAYDKDGELHNYNKVFYRLKVGNVTKLNQYIAVSYNGTVKFTQKLNLSTIYETFQSTFILFEIEAYNNENYTIWSNQSINNGKQQVNLTITDINERPYFKTFVKEMVFPEGPKRQCFPCMATPDNFTFHVMDPDFLDKYTETKFEIKGDKGKFIIIQTNTTAGLYFYLHQIDTIDYEKPDEKFFDLTITATNKFPLEDGNESNVTISLFINITDSDDNVPKFETGSIECQVEENYTGTVKNCSVKAEDIDQVYKTDFNYLISKTNARFEVSQNGSLKLMQPLDYEQQKEFHITVYANFSKPSGRIEKNVCPGTPCNTSIAVTINVININDETPQFNDTSYSFHVIESNLTDILIGNLTAYDKDSAEVNISIADNENFTVIQNGSSAYLLTKKPIDYETSQNFIVQATVFDGSFSSYANISINVLPVNEYPPIFNQSSYKWTLFENSTLTETYKFNVSDKDMPQPNFTYRIIGGNGLGLFNITGEDLSVVKSLKNSGGKNFTLTIESTDNDSPPLTGVTTVDIVIESVNLHPPSFLGPFHATVIESDQEIEVLEVFAFDEDTSQDKLTFIVTGNEKFFFKNTTGPPWKSTLYAKNLDAEQDCYKNGTCEILIHLSDGVHEETTTIFVKIEDKNDNNPCFNETVYNKSIKANISPGTVVLGVSVDDSDISNEGFTFILYDTSGDFTINRSTGIVSLARPLGKNGKNYSMQVEVLDHGSPPRSNMTFITLTIDYATPQWKLLNCSTEVPENNYTFNLQLSKFISINQTAGFTYQIISDDKFEILKTFSLSTGELKLANKSNVLDFEKQPVYSFELQVNDSGIFPQIQKCKFTINVRDMNESPEITSFAKETYQEENTTQGTFVLHIEATDPDNNPSFKNLTFSLSDNKFTIDKTGNITVNVSHLEAGNYPVNITVTDGGNMTAIDSILIVVPKINVTYSSNKLNENGTVPNIVDLSPKGIKYTIWPSPYMGKFNITENDKLVLIDPLDREVTESVSLRILGRNVTNNIILHDITLNITVMDINDCSPKFVFHNLTIFIDDITSPGTIIGYMPAKDDDVDETNRNLTYSIEEHDYVTAKNISDMFSATNDGAITLKSPVMPNDYQFKLRVYDGHFDDNVTITVSVRNTNDHSPVFTNKTYIFTITETNNTSITVGQVNATDKDGDTIYYNFSTAIDIFQIDQNGVISTKVAVDRETKDLYTLYVQATDSKTNPREDICNVTIIVTDVNDNYPQFQASHYSGTVIENSQANTTIQILPTIIATDKDNGENGTKGIYFSLNENTTFCINTTIGQDVALGTVYVCKTPIDRETKDEYSLTLYVSDGKGLTTSETLTIHVLDENDETPLFNNTDYMFDVKENVKVPYIIANISVTDMDLNGTQTVRFGLQYGGEGKFYISPISGQIYATGNIDREENGNYSLNVSAYDGIHTSYKEVLIHVIDENDNVPDFKHPNLTPDEIFVVHVTENSPGSIYNFSATDKDSASNITFTLINGSEPFHLTENGHLVLNSGLDREERDVYVFTITACDNGEPPLSSNLTVKIVVLDVNDNIPMFFVDENNVTETNCSTIEKAPLNSILKLFRTEDRDSGSNGSVSYTIEQSNVSVYFKVEQQDKSGILLIKQPLVVNNLINDLHEKGANDTVEVNVTIIAKDGGNLTSRLLIRVLVEPLNDEDTPVFTKPMYTFKIGENVTQGSIVNNVTATVPNATASHLQYSLIGNEEAFQIMGDSGTITTKGPLDRETKSSYTLAVQVRDGRIPERTAFAAVEITVEDINDNRPEFKYTYIDDLFITENINITRSLNFSAFDRDIGQNAEITYRLLEENNDSRFLLDNSTGILTINGIFDYEKNHTYNLQIVATDKGSPVMSNSTNITVQITDVNDNAPIFKNDSCKMFNISENTLHSEPICRVEASDLDSGLNGKIVYGIFNSFTGPFNVHPLNGSIYLEGMLDYETQSNYSLVILAQDQGNSSLTATLTVNVTVHDVYDDVPKFNKQVFEITVSSSAAVNTTVIDLDINIHQPNFTIQGNDADYFKIDPASGNISVAKMLDSKRENYAFTVVVYARQNASYNASAIVLVKLTGRDITFDKSEIVVRLAENLESNQIVYDLNTTEESEPTGAAYSIISVDPESGKKIFNIDESTGIVTCNQTLDREVAKTYVILIAAQSKNARQKRDTSVTSTTFRLVINVTDVNDNSPYFPEDHPYIFGVPDDARAYYLVTTVKANDPDEFDQLRYDILGERYVFNIDTRTGDLRTTAAIASANRNEFNMTILVDDGGGIHHNATLDIIIQVVPTRNQPILFINKTVADLVKQKDIIEKNMSDILGVIVQIEKIQSHRFIGEDKVFRVDISSSDLYFHGFNKTTNTMISNEEMKKLLEAFTEPLARLFGSKTNMEYAVISPLIADPSSINSSQILMICMAVFILIGTSALLVWSQYSWTKYEKEQIESLRERIEREHNDIELNSIRSRQSSKLSSLLAAAAANPGFEETEFLSNGELYPGMKNEPQYESQELRMTFGDEPIEAHIPAENLQDFVQSVVDSGVGNTSVHSGQNRESAEEEDRQSNLRSIDDEGPVMTSSPRLHRDAQQSPSTSAGIIFLDVDKETKGEVPDVTSDRSSTIEVNKTAGLVVMLDATGETETDDELDESEENNDDEIAKTAIVTESASGNRATDVILFKQGEHEHECEAAVESTAF